MGESDHIDTIEEGITSYGTVKSRINRHNWAWKSVSANWKCKFLKLFYKTLTRLANVYVSVNQRCSPFKECLPIREFIVFSVDIIIVS